MLLKKDLLSKLPIYNGKIGILKYEQNTDDIITHLLKCHDEYKKDYDKIYPYFLGNTLEETCYNIFDFLKKNVLYRIEPSTKQTLKSPSAIMAQGYGDCKQYSQFAGGILDAINRNKYKIDWCYRFASYNNDKELQHVFIVAKDNTGKEIWLDPVLSSFNNRKKYTFKEDKKPMALYKISGFTTVSKAAAAQKSFRNMTNEERSAYINSKIQSGQLTLPPAQPVAEPVTQPVETNPYYGLPETNLPVISTPEKTILETVLQPTATTNTSNISKYILPIGLFAAILILNKK